MKSSITEWERYGCGDVVVLMRRLKAGKLVNRYGPDEALPILRLCLSDRKSVV